MPGAYRFEHLYPRDYVIEVSQSGFSKAARTVRIEKGRRPAWSDTLSGLSSSQAGFRTVAFYPLAGVWE
jgi:hypothetical protein